MIGDQETKTDDCSYCLNNGCENCDPYNLEHFISLPPSHLERRNSYFGYGSAEALAHSGEEGKLRMQKVEQDVEKIKLFLRRNFDACL